MSWRGFGPLAARNRELAAVIGKLADLLNRCPQRNLLDPEDTGDLIGERTCQVQTVFGLMVAGGAMAAIRFLECPWCKKLNPPEDHPKECAFCGAEVDPTDWDEVERYQYLKARRPARVPELSRRDELGFRLHGFLFRKPIRLTANRTSAGQYEVLINGGPCYLSDQSFRIVLLLARRALTSSGDHVSIKEIAAIPGGPNRVHQAMSRLRKELMAVLSRGEAKSMIEGRVTKYGGYRLSTHSKLVKIDVPRLRTLREFKPLVDQLFPRKT
jgi:hypothetical protein